MTETERDRCANNGEMERNKKFHDSEIIMEDLLRDLEACKEEQMRLRTGLETAHRDSKRASEVAREAFSHANTDRCISTENYQESLENLQKRMSIMEMEKETVFQLWQMSLKTSNILQEESKSSQLDDRATRYYEEQINCVKETYSEAIKALESKLFQAKDNFTKHQTLWESNRQKIDSLSKEKVELDRKLTDYHIETRGREEKNARIIETLKFELESLRNEVDKARDEKLRLNEKLQEARSFATRAISKDEESQSKICEALEIVETAMREKDAALQCASRETEERTRLESRLNAIVEEYTTRLDRELTGARESFARGTKKYTLEIKELKIELREKVTLLDRLEREKKLLEEELEKVRHGSEDFFQRSSVKVLELEEKLNEANSRVESSEENCRKKYEEKIRQSDERIVELETRLENYDDRLRRTKLHSSKDFDERIREADDRTKEILERYSMLERRLARILDERENISCELRTLQSNYDREIGRRDVERRCQEARIRELQDDLQNVNNALEKANYRNSSMTKQIESLQQNLEEKINSHVNDPQTNADAAMRLRTLQEKFDQRTRELTQHVETHQKLCKRWKDEAKFLATKFQTRSKEFRDKINILRKENEELNKELLICRQQLAQNRVQTLNRYDQGDGTR